MVKNIFAIALMISLSKMAFAVEVLTGNVNDPQAAQSEQKTKKTAIEQSFEEKKEKLKKKHKERQSKKQAASNKSDDPVSTESKKVIEDIQSEVQDQNVRDNRNH